MEQKITLVFILFQLTKKNLNSRLYALDNKYYDKITGIAGIVDRKCEVSD